MGFHSVVACTAPGWSTGSISGTGIVGVVFRPCRYREALPWPKRFQPGDHHGRQFASLADVSAFALERGYCVPYRSAYAVLRVVERWALASIHARVMREIRAAATRAALVEAIDMGKRRVNRIAGGDVLAGSHYAAGWWCAARRLRPLLFREGVGC